MKETCSRLFGQAKLSKYIFFQNIKRRGAGCQHSGMKFLQREPVSELFFCRILQIEKIAGSRRMNLKVIGYQGTFGGCFVLYGKTWRIDS